MGNSLEDVTGNRHPVIHQIKERMVKYGADARIDEWKRTNRFCLVPTLFKSAESI